MPGRPTAEVIHASVFEVARSMFSGNGLAGGRAVMTLAVRGSAPNSRSSIAMIGGRQLAPWQ